MTGDVPARSSTSTRTGRSSLADATRARPRPPDSCQGARSSPIAAWRTCRERRPGREGGTLVASGPTGSVTLLFTGTRTALGQGSGTWTLGQGDRLPRRQARDARQLHDARRRRSTSVTGTLEHRRQASPPPTAAGTAPPERRAGLPPPLRVRYRRGVGSLAPGAPRALRRVAASLAAAAAASCLAGCGGPTSVPAPKPGSPAERAWLEGRRPLRRRAPVGSLPERLGRREPGDGAAGDARPERRLHDARRLQPLRRLQPRARRRRRPGAAGRAGRDADHLRLPAPRARDDALPGRDDPRGSGRPARRDADRAAAAPLLAEASSGLAELGSP